ncbi:hypothetical protein DITRI_Ditri13aG0117300 [Diplodiscus trichospermus]
MAGSLWGGFDPIPSSSAIPPGVEFWAVFNVPQHQIDASWKNLTHTLSGLFCASINFLESTTTYSAPEWSFPPASANLRYGILVRKAICTENLTPLLKLLPCRDKAGIATLLDRPSIYRGFYHSQWMHLTSTGSVSEGMDLGIILEQTLTVILQADDGRATFELSANPDSLLTEQNSMQCKSSSVFCKFQVEKYNESEPLDLGLTWKVPVVWWRQQAPLHASTFLMGSGNERGAIAISLKYTIE